MVGSELPTPAPTLSPSQKRTWLDCRGRWDFSYAQGLRLAGAPNERLTVGKYVQECLRRYHTEKVQVRSKDILMQDFYNVWDGQLSKTSETKAIKMLESFWNKFGVDEEVPPQPTEYDVSTLLTLSDLSQVRAHGILDEVQFIDNAAIIGENKTGESPDVEFYSFFNPQVYDYAWLVRRNFPDLDIYVRSTLISPSGVVRVTTEILEEVIAETEEEWYTVAEEIYGPNRLAIVYNRTFRCKDCDFYPLCFLRLTGGDVEAAKNDYIRKEK